MMSRSAVCDVCCTDGPLNSTVQTLTRLCSAASFAVLQLLQPLVTEFPMEFALRRLAELPDDVTTLTDTRRQVLRCCATVRPVHFLVPCSVIVRVRVTCGTRCCTQQQLTAPQFGSSLRLHCRTTHCSS